MYIACVNIKSVNKDNLQAFKKRNDAEKWLSYKIAELFQELYKNEAITSQLFAQKYFDTSKYPVEIKKEYRGNYEAMNMLYMTLPLLQQNAKPEIFDRTSLKKKKELPEQVSALLQAKRDAKKANCKCVDCEYCKMTKEEAKKLKEAKKRENGAKLNVSIIKLT